MGELSGLVWIRFRSLVSGADLWPMHHCPFDVTGLIHEEGESTCITLLAVGRERGHLVECCFTSTETDG